MSALSARATEAPSFPAKCAARKAFKVHGICSSFVLANISLCDCDKADKGSVPVSNAAASTNNASEAIHKRANSKGMLCSFGKLVLLAKCGLF